MWPFCVKVAVECFFHQDSLISEGSFINFASWALRYLLSGERGWRWGRVGVYRLEAAVVQCRQVQAPPSMAMFDYWLVFMVVIYKHCGIIFSVPSHFVFLTQCRRAVSESVNDSFHYDIQHWNCFLLRLEKVISDFSWGPLWSIIDKSENDERSYYVTVRKEWSWFRYLYW